MSLKRDVCQKDILGLYQGIAQRGRVMMANGQIIYGALVYSSKGLEILTRVGVESRQTCAIVTMYSSYGTTKDVPMCL